MPSVAIPCLRYRDREGHVWNVGTYDRWQAGKLSDKP